MDKYTDTQFAKYSLDSVTLYCHEIKYWQFNFYSDTFDSWRELHRFFILPQKHSDHALNDRNGFHNQGILH